MSDESAHTAPEAHTAQAASVTPAAAGDKWGDGISGERKSELEAMLAAWEATPAEQRGERKGPFDSVDLIGADVFWLAARALAVQEGKGADQAALAEAAACLLRARDEAGLRYSLSLDTLHLERARLRDAHLSQASLRDAHLEGADLRHAQLERAFLLTAHLAGASLGDAHLEQAFLRKADLAGASLPNAHLEDTSMWEVHLEGADLSVAHLEGAFLLSAHLERATLEDAHLAGANLTDAHLEGAKLGQADLEQTNLTDAHLPRASLRNARLDRAILVGAHLEEADLREAHLIGADLGQAHLEHVVLSGAHLEQADLRRAFLQGAFLRGVAFDAATRLRDAALAGVRIADVQWGGANLTVVDWELVPELGDEYEAWAWTAQRVTGKTQEQRAKQKLDQDKQRLETFKAAVRANRQLATVLQDQGMSEEASNYAERAQRLQRRVLKLQGKRGRAAWSRFLDVLAGYGYRPGRTVFWYVASVAVFGVLYFLASRGLITFGLKPSQFTSLPWYEALVLSVSSFHGRGFFQPVQSLGDPVAILAALEAVVGLLIEVSFIATFTQRFFGSR